MKSENYQFSYTVYDSINELDPQDAWLLNEAREVSQYAYAPYSNFLVGAVAKLANGEIVAGSNQGECQLSCRYMRRTRVAQHFSQYVSWHSP